MSKLKKRPMLVLSSTLSVFALVGTLLFQNAIPNVDASAMEKKLDCKYKIHKHEPGCYTADGQLTCGYADWVVHKHNKKCYDQDGKLVCKLEERAAHVHKYSCYGTATGSALTVDTPSIEVVTPPAINPGVTKTEMEDLKKEILDHKDEILKAADGDEDLDDKDNDVTDIDDDEEDDDDVKATANPAKKAATTVTPTVTAKPDASAKPDTSAKPSAKPDTSTKSDTSAKPDTSTKPDENGKHVHNANCYLTFRVLDCEENLEDKDHVHTDECYVIVEVLTCEKDKVPTDKTDVVENGDSVSGGAIGVKPADKDQKHVHTEDCYVTLRVLTCGKENDKSHTHTEGCYKTIRVTACEERVPICGEWELHTHTDKCFENGKWVCGLLQVEEHVHGDECFNVTSSITKQKTDKKDKKPTVKKKYVSNSDGKGDNREIVKTGEATTPLLAVMIVSVIAGFAYFLFGTSKGRSLIRKFKRE